MNVEPPATEKKSSSLRPFPEMPQELSSIRETIEGSRKLLAMAPDASDDLSLQCSQQAWQRAVKILSDHALEVFRKIKVAIRPPLISAGPDGSVDLYWTATPYGLLVNVPADPGEPVSYFGDNAISPDSYRTKGVIESGRPIDVGILMWLAHTAEQ